jgi:hypothetical protein
MGSSVTVLISDSALDLGERQALYLVEFAGPTTLGDQPKGRGTKRDFRLP